MQDVSKSILPKDMYVNYKDEINRWIRMLNYYYTAILNVNYNNFDKDEFMDAVNAFSITNYSEETINEYEKYVKTNQIIVNGSAKVQMPIIYFDGENIRIRMRIQYDIKNSNTKKNILFGDLNKVEDVEYKNDSNIIFIDAKLIPSSEDFNTVFIANTSINELAINNLE